MIDYISLPKLYQERGKSLRKREKSLKQKCREWFLPVWITNRWTGVKPRPWANSPESRTIHSPPDQGKAGQGFANQPWPHQAMTFCVKLTGGKKEKEERSPETEDPQVPQKCVHSPYILWKQHHSNRNNTPSLSWLHFFSLFSYFFHQLTWVSLLCFRFHQQFLSSLVCSWQLTDSCCRYDRDGSKPTPFRRAAWPPPDPHGTLPTLRQIALPSLCKGHRSSVVLAALWQHLPATGMHPAWLKGFTSRSCLHLPISTCTPPLF